MKPQLTSSLRFLVAVVIAVALVPSSTSQSDYERCRGSPYRCGGLTADYPFWGSGRPPSCGHPGFELSCEDNGGGAAFINISSASYRVLKINGDARTVTVARRDLWDTICPPGPVAGASLNFTIFDYYSAAADRNVTLYYGCAQDAARLLPNRFSCGAAAAASFGLYFTRDLPGGGFAANCTGSFAVTVNETEFASLEGAALTGTATARLLQESFRGGFTIQWSAEDGKCRRCEDTGGVCGSDPGSGSFACHCIDRTYDATCGGNGNKSYTGRNIGLSIGGAVLAGAALGWLIFYYRAKKRNKNPTVQSSKYVTNKDIFEAPSSNPTKAVSSNPPSSSEFTASTPSSNSGPNEGNSSFYGVQVFTYPELEEATDNFDPAKELGDGGFGTVYYGILRDGRVVAVKRLYENNFKRVEQFMNEVRILTSLRHANLVQLYGCTSRRSRELLLVYEYVPNGTVSDHLHGKRAGSGLLTWPVRLKIAVETARAISYLHGEGIIHRDVKTNNILLDKEFRVKVADFGLSRLFPKDNTHVSTAPQGTPGYVDPEYYQCYRLTEKSDVYSFGVVLVELLTSLQAVDTSRDRFDINLANMAVNRIQNGSLHEFVDPSLGFAGDGDGEVRRAMTSVSELAFRCLQSERDSRPSMDEVLQGLLVIKSGGGGGLKNGEHMVEIFDDDKGGGV